MTKEKKIDLNNGFMLVVGGDYENGLDVSRMIFEQWGTKEEYCYIEIRKK